MNIPRLFRGLATCLVLACAAVHGLAAAPGEAASSPAPQAAATPPVQAAAAPRRVQVLVLGQGKAVADAEVRFSAAQMSDKKLVTDESGQVSWPVPAVAKLHLRVVAKGWEVYQQEISLPAGPYRHVVELKAQAAKI